MGFKDSAGLISQMNALIIYIGKISLSDSIIQYSNIPLFQLQFVKLMGHPSGGRSKQSPLCLALCFFDRIEATLIIPPP
jgi:hypothetical protein